MNDRDRRIRSFLEGRYRAELGAADATDGKSGLRTPAALRRPPAPEDAPALYGGSRMMMRAHATVSALMKTVEANRTTIWAAKERLAVWMKEGAIVRILGAGRALLAAGLAGNRLAHGGAQVSFMGGMVPMPNSCWGGGIIAASASGKTVAVLEAMEIAKRNNPSITIIGIADHEAKAFSELCDLFIGLQPPVLMVENPLSALADQEELLIAELLDALVVLAGESLGYDDQRWRKGHEDLGATGTVERGRAVCDTFSQPELFIAATAAVHGLSVVTRNADEFIRAEVPLFNGWSGRLVRAGGRSAPAGEAHPHRGIVSH